jgi:hypothetical protein
MMTIQVSTAFAHDLMEHTGVTVADQIGLGTLVIYNGTPPIGPDTALSGNTACATFTFTAASTQSDTNGVLSLAFSSQTVTASASSGSSPGATFFRIINSSSAAIIQGTVAASGADFNLSSIVITSGDNVTITGTGTITFANIS